MKQRSTGVRVLSVAVSVLIVGSMGALGGQSAPFHSQSTSATPAAVARNASSLVNAAAQSTAPPETASTASERALLDRYCVTCHNDRLKTANLSLEGLDLTNVAE